MTDHDPNALPAVSQTSIALITPPPVVAVKISIRDEIKSTAFTFIKTGFVVVLLIIVFQWADRNYKIRAEAQKVKVELWLGLAGAIAKTYWTWHSNREKIKLELTISTAAANTASIKAVSESFENLVKRLESRIDSVLLQIADIRSSQAENIQVIEKFEESESELEKRIGDYRYEALKERAEILKGFYDEICALHAQLNFIRGVKEGDRQPISVNQLNQIITALYDKIKLLETSEDMHQVSDTETSTQSN